MNITQPAIITARLLPGVKISQAFVSIDYSKRPGSERGRKRYRWFLDLPGNRSFTGDDLQSGCGGGSLQEGLTSLIVFLQAAGESYAHRMRTGLPERCEDSNENLFPESVVRWAYEELDSLCEIECELLQNPKAIEE